MKTAYEVKAALDPMTMWNAVESRVAENRMNRMKRELEKAKKEKRFLEWCTTHHRLKVLEGGLDA